MEPEEYEKRLEKINDIRAALDYLETNPDVPMPFFGILNASAEKDDLSKIAKAMSPVDKKVDSGYFILERMFGKVKYHVNFPREGICTPTVVGTEVVPRLVIAEHTREIVEWNCPESILN